LACAPSIPPCNGFSGESSSTVRSPRRCMSGVPAVPCSPVLVLSAFLDVSRFNGESGIDAGGLSVEFFDTLWAELLESKELFDRSSATDAVLPRVSAAFDVFAWLLCSVASICPVSPDRVKYSRCARDSFLRAMLTTPVPLSEQSNVPADEIWRFRLIGRLIVKTLADGRRSSSGVRIRVLAQRRSEGERQQGA
jgi:hypothetical protein